MRHVHDHLIQSINIAQQNARNNVSKALVDIYDKQSSILEYTESGIENDFGIFREWLFSKKKPDGNVEQNKQIEDEKYNQFVLKIFNELCEESKIPVVRISGNRRSISEIKPMDSYIGAIPGFLPKGFKVPSVNGHDLVFLAQVDCSNLTHLPDFPHKGILSFWMNMDVYSEKSDSFVFYFEDTTNGMTKEEIRSSIPDNEDCDCGPFIDRDIIDMMTFTNDEDVRDLFSEDVDHILVDKYNSMAKDAGYPDITLTDVYDVQKLLSKLLGDACPNTAGTKFGGYPDFTQSDPRYPDYKEILLFQCDSGSNIMWGDCGVGNFFITPEDLKKKNFREVLFNWDCY